MNIRSILIIFLLGMSGITFLLFGIDKRRAMRGEWRISEEMLLICSLFGGIGGLFGMRVFRHKTRKWKFRILVPLFAALQILLAAALVMAPL